MDKLVILNLMRETLIVTVMLNTPVLLVSLVVGLLVAVLQTTTQIQEQNLTYVPKVFMLTITLILTGNWMLTTLTDFTLRLFNNLGRFGY